MLKQGSLVSPLESLRHLEKVLSELKYDNFISISCGLVENLSVHCTGEDFDRFFPPHEVTSIVTREILLDGITFPYEKSYIYKGIKFLAVYKII